MNHEATGRILKAARNFTCNSCGSDAALLHTRLTDRLAGTGGFWSIYRCVSPQCGLAWIDPKPSTAQLLAAYESYYTHDESQADSWLRRRYERLRTGYLSVQYGYPSGNLKSWEKLAGQLLACLPHRRAAFDASVMWLPARLGGKVLEIGCGNGTLLRHLVDLGWQAEGIEPDSTAAILAQKRGLRVTVGKLGEQHFDIASFDAIIMSHVIEHVEEPAALIRRCREILKPDGRLVMLTPNLEALGHRWFGRNWLHLDPPRHLYLFTRGSILDACRSAGFGKVECKSTVRDANWTMAASLALRFAKTYRLGKFPRLLRIVGMMLLYIEWLVILFQPDRGEELRVIACHESPSIPPRKSI